MMQDLTELVFIIDRSGSMAGLEGDTIGGINATLAAHRKTEGEAVVNTVLFDNEVEVLHDRVPLADVADLTEKDYWVRGCTALLDAVGGGIHHVERVHRYLPEEYRPAHTVFVITTDGMENASRNYTYDQVKRAISRKQEEGWDFLFLGANIDAAAEADRMGIRQDRAATYIADECGSQAMFEAVACASVDARLGSLADGAAWAAPIAADTARRKSKHPFSRKTK